MKLSVPIRWTADVFLLPVHTEMGCLYSSIVLPQDFMAIQSPEMIKKSRMIAMIWVIITLIAAVAIGVIGKAYMPELADGETIYMVMIDSMFPDVIAGILLTAILAAIMSTASSQLLVTASSASRDLYALSKEHRRN